MVFIWQSLQGWTVAFLLRTYNATLGRSSHTLLDMRVTRSGEVFEPPLHSLPVLLVSQKECALTY